MPVGEVRDRSPISSLVLTFGCKFACPYCPIPAYNQRQYRVKSGERIADEMFRLNSEYGLRFFFGADDNFFNDKSRTLDIVEKLARAEFDGVKLNSRARWYTEVTVHDTLQMKEHLPLVREAGCRALWLGVEDLTATLVKKGQSADKTTEAFRALRDAGICPMPMMMHHDSQPLYSRGSNYGLLNQVELLRKAGAVSLQVLMITPAVGSKLLESTYTSGQVFKSVGGKAVRPHMCDGNYVVASKHRRPWQKQLTMLAGYLYFYNPVWLAVALIRSKTPVAQKPAYLQIFGMMGLVMTIARTSGWAMRLMFGRIERQSRPPASRNSHARRGRRAGESRHVGAARRNAASAGSPSGAPARDGGFLNTACRRRCAKESRDALAPRLSGSLPCGYCWFWVFSDWRNGSRCQFGLSPYG